MNSKVLSAIGVVAIVALILLVMIFVVLKKTYTIAIIGDSMVDTMQTDFPFLMEQLHATYPGVTFKVYNYGIGAQNAEMGLKRLSQPLVYKDRDYPPFAQLHPDIVIVGSWAYNPFSPHNPAKHKEVLTKIVEKAQAASPNVYLLKEIAPLSSDFGRGIRGVNWDKQQSTSQAEKIIDQLNNVDDIAEEKSLPVINVHQYSVVKGTKFGTRELVSYSDGIHPSPTGHRLMAQVIVNTAQLERLALFTVLTGEGMLVRNPFFGMLNNDVPTTFANSEPIPSKTIGYNMIQANNLTTGVSALRFLQLDKILFEEGQYTLFIPDNSAFEKLPKEKVEEFYFSHEMEKNKKLFSTYIVKGVYQQSDLKDGTVLKTIGGQELKITVKDGKTLINGVATVIKGDIKTSNGVIQVIDEVWLDDNTAPKVQ